MRRMPWRTRLHWIGRLLRGELVLVSTGHGTLSYGDRIVFEEQVTFEGYDSMKLQWEIQKRG